MDDFGFKFKVGDKVGHVLCDGVQIGVVIERWAMECPGGVQRNYVVRTAGTRGVNNDYVRFNEIELTPARDANDPLIDALQTAKEYAVSVSDFDLAARIRELAEQAKKKERVAN